MSQDAWQPAYVGLGSNLADPIQQMRAAFEELAQIDETRLVARSSLYRSPPLGPPDQPDYINAVAGLLTQLGPDVLLARLQSIEQRHRRDRSGPRWGPRTLDLDLLIYADHASADARLTLPHPHLHERAFVLVPLAEIAPGLRLPGHGRVDVLAALTERNALAIVV